MSTTSESTAKARLSLPDTYDVGVEFTIKNSPKIYGPGITKAVSAVQAGGGIEYYSNDPVEIFITQIWTLLK